MGAGDGPFEVRIDDIGAQGDGVARFAGAVLFVPMALPGERVVVEKTAAARARVVRWLSRSPARAEPPCRHYAVCGGCAAQHFADEHYVGWKSSLASDALARRGLRDITIAPLARTPPAARRRAEFAARRRGDTIELGFHGRDARAIVDVESCTVLRAEIAALLPGLRDLLGRLAPVGGTTDVHVTRSDTGNDILLTGVRDLDLAAREACASYAREAGIARLAWRRAARASAETIAMRTSPRMHFAGVAVDLPPGAFIQASAEGEAAIVDAVARASADARRIADLYAGCGTLSFPLAGQGARVRAIEGDAGQVAAFDAAIRRAGLAGRLSIERRDLARRPLVGDELAGFDVVVLDPPRAGARAQAEALARSNVAHVIAVSCDPGSFARDARILVDGGYRLESVAPIDQFLWSPHLELVGVFRR